MTLKARALGMASTTYVNASGLPAQEQITTARDQAVLGRAIQHRFPGYYRYFATPSFHYKGVEMHNHNALLRQVKASTESKRVIRKLLDTTWCHRFAATRSTSSRWSSVGPQMLRAMLACVN